MSAYELNLQPIQYHKMMAYSVESSYERLYKSYYTIT